ncbi:hypothetical protein [Arcticibacter svalbardensis]|nr:hypothetical protein [Arcticibacter svalbardensis]
MDVYLFFQNICHPGHWVNTMQFTCSYKEYSMSLLCAPISGNHDTAQNAAMVYSLFATM